MFFADITFYNALSQLNVCITGKFMPPCANDPNCAMFCARDLTAESDKDQHSS
jgi:hypothetical protein